MTVVFFFGSFQLFADDPFIVLGEFTGVPARARSFGVKWSGGSTETILTFELHRADGKLEYTLPGVANTGEIKFVIPRHVKPGKGYYLRVFDSKNRELVVESQRFQIRRTYPLVAQAAVVVIAGFAIYKSLPEKDTMVQGPPNPPGN
jgi:hypothetical protein